MFADDLHVREAQVQSAVKLLNIRTNQRRVVMAD